MRANFYIDGYNFYSGLCADGLHGWVWIDLQKMCNALILRQETLHRIRYFTSLPYFKKKKRDRHETYLRAISASCPLVETHMGDFAKTDVSVECPLCGAMVTATCTPCNWKAPRHSYSEKMTDVSLAVELVNDARNNDFDIAYVISGDTDLVPAVRMVKSYNPQRKVGMFFPPKRMTGAFFSIADFGTEIHGAQIRKVQLPDPVIGPNGPISKPISWNP